MEFCSKSISFSFRQERRHGENEFLRRHSKAEFSSLTGLKTEFTISPVHPDNSREHPSRKGPDLQITRLHRCVPYWPPFLPCPPSSKGNVSNTELPPEIRSICKVCACSHCVEIHLAVSGRKEQCLGRWKTHRLASQIQLIQAPGPTFFEKMHIVIEYPNNWWWVGLVYLIM